jgi:hypothetical protein
VGEITQTLYAHMNKIKIKKKKLVNGDFALSNNLQWVWPVCHKTCKITR